MAVHDVVSLDGKVHDPNRIDYLYRHLMSLQRAVKEGIDVAGYFQWPLMITLSEQTATRSVSAWSM